MEVEETEKPVELICQYETRQPAGAMVLTPPPATVSAERRTVTELLRGLVSVGMNGELEETPTKAARPSASFLEKLRQSHDFSVSCSADPASSSLWPTTTTFFDSRLPWRGDLNRVSERPVCCVFVSKFHFTFAHLGLSETIWTWSRAPRNLFPETVRFQQRFG